MLQFSVIKLRWFLYHRLNENDTFNNAVYNILAYPQYFPDWLQPRIWFCQLNQVGLEDAARAINSLNGLQIQNKR